MKQYRVYCHVSVLAKSEAEAALSLMDYAAIAPVTIDRVVEEKHAAASDGDLRTHFGAH